VASEPPRWRGVDALNSLEMHKAIAVLDHVHAAMMLMRELSPAALEGLRDVFEHMANERAGPRGELRRAWAAFATQTLADARTRTRKGEFALSPT
jgi:hypothetical protein